MVLSQGKYYVMSKSAIKNGLIKMNYPDNPTNKNQTYYKWKVK